ncbi:MAG TPA: hypothetical protein VF937_01290 [Chloroflexota bacterium]
MPRFGLPPRRIGALGVLSTGVVCPCHVLVGLVGLATGGSLLSPAAQDGLHAVYVPFAILAGAALLRGRGSRALQTAAPRTEKYFTSG